MLGSIALRISLDSFLTTSMDDPLCGEKGEGMGFKGGCSVL